MKERPILFNGAMVRAVLDGSKTQTRRIVKLPHENPLGQWEPSTVGGPEGGQTTSGATIPRQASIWHTRTGDNLMCPYGQPGDQLWVRESYADAGCRLTYRADLDDGAHCKVQKWTPSIHMFRADSRILLEIVSVRVERLSEISETNALAEGITYSQLPENPQDDQRARTWYRGLWEQINGAGSWSANPWVWVVEFRKVDT